MMPFYDVQMCTVVKDSGFDIFIRLLTELKIRGGIADIYIFFISVTDTVSMGSFMDQQQPREGR